MSRDYARLRERLSTSQTAQERTCPGPASRASCSRSALGSVCRNVVKASDGWPEWRVCPAPVTVPGAARVWSACRGAHEAVSVIT